MTLQQEIARIDQEIAKLLEERKQLEESVDSSSTFDNDEEGGLSYGQL